MDEGLYESLITEQLHQAIQQRPDLHPETNAVDDAERPLTIARHLAPIIERSLRTVPSAHERAGGHPPSRIERTSGAALRNMARFHDGQHGRAASPRDDFRTAR